MKSWKWLCALISIICIAAISDKPGELDSSYGDSLIGAACNCQHSSTKVDYSDPTSCPTSDGCTGYRVTGWTEKLSTGDTLDIGITHNHCAGTSTCIAQYYANWYSTSDCTSTTY